MKSESGKYNDLWFTLLHRAEEAKVLLSSKTSADIEVQTEDDTGEELDLLLTITRSEFESLLKPQIDRTADMIKSILVRNSLRPSDLQFILMVGGSTYIPLVRQRVGELLQIPINCEIDPTTAVVIGAAHFAANRPRDLTTAGQRSIPVRGLNIKLSYNRSSQDSEELLAGKVEGPTSGLYYRILREDGGFDSGVKALSTRITEDLPLVADSFNIFNLKVMDEHHSTIELGIAPIQIAHGKYNVAGQMVPHDVSLVVDDLAFNRTKLLPVFRKNTILPGKTRLVVSTNQTVVRGSPENVIRIMVVEGPEDAIPASNLKVGELTISGNDLQRDLIKGSDIELSFEMTESRSLEVSSYIPSIDQEFKSIFTPDQREVKVETLVGELRSINQTISAELLQAEAAEDFERASILNKLQKAGREIDDDLVLTSADDVTDERYKLEDRKRRLAQEVDSLTRGNRIQKLREDYRSMKNACEEVIFQSGNDQERHLFGELLKAEPALLSTQNPMRLEKAIDELRHLKFKVLRRVPSFLLEWFDWLCSQRHRLNNQEQAKSLIEAGKLAASQERFDRLEEVNWGLNNLLPDDQKQTATERGFTNIS